MKTLHRIAHQTRLTWVVCSIVVESFAADVRYVYGWGKHFYLLHRAVRKDGK